MPGTISAFYGNTTATIGASGTKTGAIGFASFSRGIFILPTGFEGTSITFEVSNDGVNFVALNDSSGAIALTVAAAKGYALPAALAGALWFKLVAGTQAAARTIELALKY